MRTLGPRLEHVMMPPHFFVISNLRLDSAMKQQTSCPLALLRAWDTPMFRYACFPERLSSHHQAFRMGLPASIYETAVPETGALVLWVAIALPTWSLA